MNKRILSHLATSPALLALTLLVAPAARATSGNINAFNKTLTEDHYGTITITNGYLDCAHHNIYNSDQPAICYDGNATTPFRCGIYIPYGVDVDLYRCHITGFDQGITITGGDDGGIWIQENYPWFNGDGINASFVNGGSLTRSVYIFGGTDVSYNYDEGIKFDSLQYAKVKASWVWWNAVDGIDSNYNYSLLLEANDIRENGDHGIEIDYGAGPSVKGNYVDGYDSADGVAMEQLRDGIQLEELSSFSVQNNTVRDAGRHGIYLHNASTGTVSGNNVSGSARKTTGYDCRKNGGSSVTFSSNTFGTKSGCP
jgi:parallel beta-helix repeat protein